MATNTSQQPLHRFIAVFSGTWTTIIWTLTFWKTSSFRCQKTHFPQNDRLLAPWMMQGGNNVSARWIWQPRPRSPAKNRLVAVITPFWIPCTRDESRKLNWGNVKLQVNGETNNEELVWTTERGSKWGGCNLQNENVECRTSFVGVKNASFPPTKYTNIRNVFSRVSCTYILFILFRLKQP